MEAYPSLKILESGERETFGNWRQEGPWFIAGRRRSMAVFECTACGQFWVVRKDHLTGGKTKGCCGQKTHGMSSSSEYLIYQRMLERCHNPSHAHFSDYGGRGIKVCDDWRGEGGFERFFAYVGERPSPNHQIDREDNNCNYEPGNVRWVTRTENCRNKRSNVLLTIDGVTKCVTEWALVEGASNKFLIYGRASRGWNHKEAVFGRVKCESVH